MRGIHAGVQGILKHEHVAVVGLEANMALALAVDPQLRSAFEQRPQKVAELPTVELDHHAWRGLVVRSREVGADVARAADESIAHEMAPAEPHGGAHEA